MDSLPPVYLGAVILGSYLPFFALRKLAVRWIVLSRPTPERHGPQFLLDIAINVIAGLTGAMILRQTHGFPVMSGVSLLLGSVAAGFFIGAQTALLREREDIVAAVQSGVFECRADNLRSVSRKFIAFGTGLACCAAVIISLVVVRDLALLVESGNMPDMLPQAITSTTKDILFVIITFLVAGTGLILSYSRNLRMLFNSQTDVLERVTLGDLSHKVPVLTNDEFGQIAGHTNSMIDGLRHRFELVSALKVAEEVQATLLPAPPEELPGLDVAARLQYSDETGGDYYDFLPADDNTLTVVVADVTGHGVSAALLMAASRAYARAFMDKGCLGTSMAGINGMITADVGDTGRFVTMFLMKLCPVSRAAKWVRAGHDPALVYDPATDTFFELKGNGMALGVVPDFPYEEYRQENLPEKAILCLTTDGIWEAHHESGEMYGRERFKAVIRSCAHEPAATIADAVLADLDRFLEGRSPEDDATIVIMKFA